MSTWQQKARTDDPVSVCVDRTYFIAGESLFTQQHACFEGFSMLIVYEWGSGKKEGFRTSVDKCFCTKHIGVHVSWMTGL